MGLDAFLDALQDGIARLRRAGPDITLVHHNDADGLASAAVMQTALSRAGFQVRRIPLERVHPPIVERIHDQHATTIMYVDLGGKAAPVISAANRGRRFTLILDHHHPEAVTDPTVLNLTTEFFGLSGDMDISAATAAYLFARTLNAGNRDLAYLGVIGAVGDRHDRGGRLVGQNRQALVEAAAQGDVQIETAPDGREHYRLIRFGEAQKLASFWRSVTTLGAAGYYLGGPEVGVQMCLSGPSAESRQKLAELDRLQDAAFNRALTRLRRDGLKQTRYCQWFSVERDFAPMGVKMIGQFCEDITGEPFVDPHKYVVGCQIMDGVVPGLGTFDWTLYKVSMRVPAALEKQILEDLTMPGLAYLVPEAAKKVGGSIDACHNYAAATVIDVDKAGTLVAEMDRLVDVARASDREG